MPQSLANVLIHLVFSTKNRHPWLREEVRDELHRYLGGVLNNLDCPSVIVGGVDDHVHVLCRFSRTRSIAEVVEALKTSSSKWIKTKGREFAGFHWQSGYGVFSVSPSDAEAVIAYIGRQAEHHRKVSFQDEYRQFLERHKVAYDERYVWD
jgi:putative transposase